MELSIILINYNSTKYTINCIESILNVVSRQLHYEIIIIDNNSSENEVIELRGKIKNFNCNNIIYIESNENLGFSGGNMLGADVAKGKCIAFVNNDTIFHEDSFSILYNFMQDDKSIGVSTCLSKNKEGKDFACFDHFIGIRKEIFGRWILEHIFKKPKRKKTYKKPIIVDAVQGCLMFFDRKAFFDSGGFDKKIFLFYEEIDICKRLKDKGYKSMYYPETFFIHFQGASTKNAIHKKIEIMVSFFYVLKKNFGYTRYYVISLFYLFKYLLKFLFDTKKIIFLKIILSSNKFKYSMRKNNY